MYVAKTLQLWRPRCAQTLLHGTAYNNNNNNNNNYAGTSQ